MGLKARSYPSLCSHVSSNLVFGTSGKILWHPVVLCTPNSKKTQIESDLIFSMYEFLEKCTTENLLLALYAAKYSRCKFNRVSLDEPIESNTCTMYKMAINFPNPVEKDTISISLFITYPSITKKVKVFNTDIPFGNALEDGFRLKFIEIAEMYEAL